MGLFEETRSQAKDIEKEIELKLEHLSQINSSLNPELIEVTSEKNPEQIIISRVESLLNQLKHLVSSLQNISETQIEKSTTVNFSQFHKNSFKQLSDLKNSIQDKRWQQQLLGNQFNNTDFTKTEMLLKEEKALDDTMELSRNILASAKDVRVSLAYQSQRLNSTSEKLAKFAQMIPGINFIMKRISVRQRFNALVIGLAISICLCIIVYKLL